MLKGLKNSYLHQLRPCWCKNHQEHEGGADDDVDDDVDHEDEESDGGAGGVSLEFLVVREHGSSSQMSHGWRIAGETTEKNK